MSQSSGKPRVFISHSSRDDEFCELLAVALMDAGADVFVDALAMKAGNLRATFRREIAARDVFILVLSKAAMRARWVRFECGYARKLIRKGKDLTLLPVLVEDVAKREYGWRWRFLEELLRVGDEHALPPEDAKRETLESLGLRRRGVLERSLLHDLVSQVLVQSCRPLPPVADFAGDDGIYMLYYNGSLPAYTGLTAINVEVPTVPIYVGTTGDLRALLRFPDDPPTGSRLYNTLCAATRNIEATDLHLANFQCRYLAIQSHFLRDAEATLLLTFRPVWNTVLTGFGNHNPGQARVNSARSPWDTLHPGREWAEHQQPNKRTADEWAGMVRTHLADTLPQISTRAEPRLQFGH